MYDLYFLRRYIEEMVLAQTAANERERAVHLTACRHYGELLHMNDEVAPPDAAPPARSPP
ncbi:MAG: hypothetical protein ACM3ZV_14640 [Bacillota bacterium]